MPAYWFLWGGGLEITVTKARFRQQGKMEAGMQKSIYFTQLCEVKAWTTTCEEIVTFLIRI